MSEFALYFGLGRDHILDYANGYDHILFVVALCALYTVTEWKRVLILVTAFTVGHSITLALATSEMIVINAKWVEFLIPLTIMITAISNLFKKEDSYRERRVQLNYMYALFFGLIHGMGFSNYLRQLMRTGESVITPLFAFNIGLELGQIIIVVLFLAVSFIFVDLIGVSRRDWKLVVSSAIAGISFILIRDSQLWREF